jgi:hypothetical protein
MTIKEQIMALSVEILKLSTQMKAVNDPEYYNNGELMRLMATRMRFWTDKLKDIDA